MKNLCKLAIIAIAAVSTGCGISKFNAANVEGTQTQVRISEGNFRVIKNVEGFASATYILGIGGLSKETARNNAVSDMFKKAKLESTQTIININVKQHISTILGLYMRISYSATGQVIEFDRTNNAPTAESASSASENTSLATPSYNIGDYYNDGTKEGVIFEISDDKKHGKILKFAGEAQWSTTNRLVGCNKTSDGMDIMRQVKQIDNWEVGYPAFALCAKLGEDWYLPTIAELQTIYANRQSINSSLKEQNKPILVFNYWSSTEFNRNKAICYTYNKLIASKSAKTSIVAVSKF